MMIHGDSRRTKQGKKGLAVLDVRRRLGFVVAQRREGRQAGDLSTAVEWALIVIGLIAMQVLLPFGLFGDGERRYQQLAALLEHGDPSTDIYSLVGPLFSAPLYLVGRAFGDSGAWVAHFNSLVFDLGLLTLYLLLRQRLDPRVLRAFILILMTASLFPDAIIGYYGETFTVITVGVGLVAAVFGPSLAGWAGAVIGTVNTPGVLLGLALASLHRVLARRRWRYVLAPVAVLALVGVQNWAQRGNPLHGGYEAGFTYPVVLGLLAILFSLGKGLLFFVPGLFLPVKRDLFALRNTDAARLYAVYGLWLALIAGLILLYSTWYDWNGNWYWGPRFFLIASLPASLVLAVRLRQRAASLGAKLLTLGVLAVSTWVGANGVLYWAQTTLWGPCVTQHQLDLCAYSPQYNVLIYPILVHEPPHVQAVIFSGYALLVFLYLAAPLVRDIVVETTAWLRAHDGEHNIARRVGQLWRWF
jgi:hypothetical protein